MWMLIGYSGSATVVYSLKLAVITWLYDHQGRKTIVSSDNGEKSAPYFDTFYASARRNGWSSLVIFKPNHATTTLQFQWLHNAHTVPHCTLVKLALDRIMDIRDIFCNAALGEEKRRFATLKYAKFNSEMALTTHLDLLLATNPITAASSKPEKA